MHMCVPYTCVFGHESLETKSSIVCVQYWHTQFHSLFSTQKFW